MQQSEIKVAGHSKRPAQTMFHDRYYMSATNIPVKKIRQETLQSVSKRNGGVLKHSQCSSRCCTWHLLTFHDHMGGLIDCIDSEGLSRLRPLHQAWSGSFQSVAALDNPGFFISNIIRASSLHVISGLLPAGEQVLGLTWAIFHIPCWGNTASLTN